MSGENTRQKHEPWKQGESGNPNGRPKGSRNKLGEQFLADLYADWEQHGVQVLETVRKEKPDQYLKVVASILPRELKIETSSDLSDDELAQRIRQLADAIGIDVGTTGADGGAETAH